LQLVGFLEMGVSVSERGMETFSGGSAARARAELRRGQLGESKTEISAGCAVGKKFERKGKTSNWPLMRKDRVDTRK